MKQNQSPSISYRVGAVEGDWGADMLRAHRTRGTTGLLSPAPSLHLSLQGNCGLEPASLERCSPNVSPGLWLQGPVRSHFPAPLPAPSRHASTLWPCPGLKCPQRVPPTSIKGRAGGIGGQEGGGRGGRRPKQEQAHTGPATQATTGTRRPEEN